MTCCRCRSWMVRGRCGRQATLKGWPSTMWRPGETVGLQGVGPSFAEYLGSWTAPYLGPGVLAQPVDNGQLAGGVQGPRLVLDQRLPRRAEPGGHAEHGHPHRQGLQVHLERALLAALCRARQAPVPAGQLTLVSAPPAWFTSLTSTWPSTTGNCNACWFYSLGTDRRGEELTFAWLNTEGRRKPHC